MPVSRACLLESSIALLCVGGSSSTSLGTSDDHEDSTDYHHDDHGDVICTDDDDDVDGDIDQSCRSGHRRFVISEMYKIIMRMVM